MSWLTFDPSPSRGWVRYAPRVWPAVDRPYLDLARRNLVWPSGQSASGPDPLAPPAPPDLVYLPPVAPERRSWRDQVAAAVAAAGAFVVQHDLAGNDGEMTGAGWRVVDLTPLVLTDRGRESEVWRAMVEPSAAPLLVVVPLVAGVTPPRAGLSVWLEAVASWRPRALIGVTPELTPHDRRGLVGLLGEESFEVIFHGRPPSERELALAAAEHRLSIFPRRPPIASLPPRGARNRELAARLAEAGELWLGLDRPEAEGTALAAAARHLDATHLDVAALAREGNLSLLDFLAPIARRVVEEELEEMPGGGLVTELRALWGGKLAG